MSSFTENVIKSQKIQEIKKFRFSHLIDNDTTASENFNQSDSVIEKEELTNESVSRRQSVYQIYKDSNIAYSIPIVDQSFSDTTHHDYFMREIEVEANHNKQINKERRKINNLNDQILRLDGFYRLKHNLQR